MYNIWSKRITYEIFEKHSMGFLIKISIVQSYEGEIFQSSHNFPN